MSTRTMASASTEVLPIRASSWSRTKPAKARAVASGDRMTPALTLHGLHVSACSSGFYRCAVVDVEFLPPLVPARIDAILRSAGLWPIGTGRCAVGARVRTGLVLQCFPAFRGATCANRVSRVGRVVRFERHATQFRPVDEAHPHRDRWDGPRAPGVPLPRAAHRRRTRRDGSRAGRGRRGLPTLACRRGT